MRRMGVLAAVLTTALIAGCGGGEGGPTAATPEQEQAIEAVIADYETALADGDSKAVCATIDPAQVEQLGGEKACTEFFDAAIEQETGALPGTESRPPVERIDIADTGELARVYYEGEEQFTRLVLVDGQWYLSTGAAPAA